MALYNRGKLPANASVASPEYRKAAFQHYEADLTPVRRQAGMELSDELAGRGLSPQGGQAIQGRLDQRGDFLRNLAQKRQELGIQQAGLAEGNRQRLEDREFQLDDMRTGTGFEDEMLLREREDRANMRRQQLFNSLWGTAGRVGGTLAASRFRPKGPDELNEEDVASSIRTHARFQ